MEDVNDPRYDSHEVCRQCQGTGSVIVPGHGCYGDVGICKTICPVPEDETCVSCGGSGMIEVEDEGDPFP